MDLRWSRRYAECTRWEAFVHHQFPAPPSPTTSKERARLHKAVDPILVADPDLQTVHQPLRTKIALGIALLETARRHQGPLRVLGFESWSRAEELGSMARYRHKDWLSVLKQNRHLATNRFVLKETTGNPIRLAGPHMAVEDLVPLIPPPAYREGTVGDTTSWTLTLAVRLPGLGTVRLVVRFKHAALTGTSAVLVTNRVDWHAPRISALSLPRWPRETLYQDGKTPLGLEESRLRTAEAMKNHGCLVFVA